ncbi:hypothetical protein Ahy_B09g098959 isoform A [Arachis hypogaea]|uniref:Transposase MuDR plant domain-containing protein n=1 Tax=Arachis hypogaea TaxID=3818 RepID=A0A444XTE3_ARAHY|nr:hypothetical protein Ahy_B09g098959 isoform A [Arachis hypogaea]
MTSLSLASDFAAIARSNIAALWCKDPGLDDSETNLKMLKGDADAIEMCDITGLRGLVELFVVHDVGDAEGDSACDIHFTNSEEEYEYDSAFDEDNSVPKKDTASKGKRVKTSQISDVDVVDSDELEIDYMIGGDEGEDDANDASDHGGQRFSVHKLLKNMSSYRWVVGILYASRQEFKDTVLAYAVHTARSIKFKKCDLVGLGLFVRKIALFGSMHTGLGINPYGS